MQRTVWGKAIQGASGLWFKGGIDSKGRRNLLVAQTSVGLETGSHDHYWEMENGNFGVQLRNRDGTSSVADKKGHIFPINTTFPLMVNKFLKPLFDQYCAGLK
ncbi:hypothetical protein SAMN02982917_6285 [Azospirillum oryzae]|uniref:Uncharacterized protein n=1 Tax=Azospirillum oryzae TaxID=286727 RepID=A0A1X7HIT4_9PROT|nr:hypothetical protein [Azospirillum oryzae]SMF87464.1 hypothetical protein SAMN02982917_6285 [Azospirillum oryzae]